MNVVVAIDSFKGSMTSLEAGGAVADGIKAVCDAEVAVCPIADGGEGTVDALVTGCGGRLMTTIVTGPLGEPVEAKWGILSEGSRKIAIIEMAEAAGIALLKREQLNPYVTTTYGVGELIMAAFNEGCRKFIIGIGGSSTNDGGVGMLQALGFKFLDANGNQIERGAKGLGSLISISEKDVDAKLLDSIFLVACDVKNPLCGEQGCSAVFGPQKGATPEMIKNMDQWLYEYAMISGGDLDYPGTGAAGGLGFAFYNFLGAKLKSGIEIVLEETKIEEKIKNADIVVTGEGRMDSQTIMGKAPTGVAAIARKYDKKVIAFCGCAADDAAVVNDYGIDAYFTILQNVVSLDEAMDKDTAKKNMTATVSQVFRLLV